MTKHIVIPGGSGFLGSHLAPRLVARGDRVTILTRGSPGKVSGCTYEPWTGHADAALAHVLDGADAIVHLTGKRVDCRPTKRNIDELIASRVEPVFAVGEACRSIARPPPAWVQISSIAIYGEFGDAVIDEQTPVPETGPRQMVEVCRKWEAAFAKAAITSQRRVLLRGGIGLGGLDDPATRRLAALARSGLGGPVGSGRQWVSWIALEDYLRILLRAIDDPAMSGLYHVTSPNPVQNREMMATYREVVGRSFGLPAPAFVARIGAWLLGSDPELALTSRRAVPSRLIAEGYEFAVTDFAAAVAEAVRERSAEAGRS